MDKPEDTEQEADIEVEITNGKKVKINLDPGEWAIISIALCVFAWTTGLML